MEVGADGVGRRGDASGGSQTSRGHGIVESAYSIASDQFMGEPATTERKEDEGRGRGDEGRCDCCKGWASGRGGGGEGTGDMSDQLLVLVRVGNATLGVDVEDSVDAEAATMEAGGEDDLRDGRATGRVNAVTVTRCGRWSRRKRQRERALYKAITTSSPHHSRPTSPCHFASLHPLSLFSASTHHLPAPPSPHSPPLRSPNHLPTPVSDGWRGAKVAKRLSDCEQPFRGLHLEQKWGRQSLR